MSVVRGLMFLLVLMCSWCLRGRYIISCRLFFRVLRVRFVLGVLIWIWVIGRVFCSSCVFIWCGFGCVSVIRMCCGRSCIN